MCLIAWNWQPASDTPLLLLGNRDEFYARPTRALQWWDDGIILAGQDLQAGGTWLGVGRSGRLAALTNVRAPGAMRDGTPSRGELVAAFLRDDCSAADFLQTLAPRAQDYNPFNLLVFDGTSLMGLHSKDAQPTALQPGIGAVSNASFDTPWPKLVQLKARLSQQLHKSVTDDAALLALLHDGNLVPDADLPSTGLPLELGRGLSAAFIAMPGYGTRASSLVRFQQGSISFTEQGFSEAGMVGASHQRFSL
jgi:uncharacterized protein with NRDE domain